MSRRALEFWSISRRGGDRPEWLGATWPTARTAIERIKVWTLVPSRLAFIANWYVSIDHAKPAEEAYWLHEWVEHDQARLIALEVADPPPQQIARLTDREAIGWIERVDRLDIESTLGTRTAQRLAKRAP